MADEDHDDLTFESELATKAPESDAHATDASSAAPTEPPAAENPPPALGEHCTSDRPTPPNLQPRGHTTTLAGTETYISLPPTYPSVPARLLLHLTPGTGLSPNSRLQADAWAAKGFAVLMPDQFAGDPAPNPSAPTTPATTPGISLVDRIKSAFEDSAQSFRIDMWAARHTPETVLPVLRAVLDAAGEEYADAIAYGNGVYAVGYCFGARGALLLAGEGRVKAIAVAHPAGVTKDDFAGLGEGTRVAVAAVEGDVLFGDEIREYGLKGARERGAVVEERVWEGVPHGFAVVGEYGDEAIAKAQTEAFEMMSGFLLSEA